MCSEVTCARVACDGWPAVRASCDSWPISLGVRTLWSQPFTVLVTTSACVVRLSESGMLEPRQVLGVMIQWLSISTPTRRLHQCVHQRLHRRCALPQGVVCGGWSSHQRMTGLREPRENGALSWLPEDAARELVLSSKYTVCVTAYRYQAAIRTLIITVDKKHRGPAPTDGNLDAQP